MSTAAYLRRLGIDGLPPPTLATLVDLHRRHLAALPYDNLEIMLGRPPSVDPAQCRDRAGRVGRVGYCFHHNAALELVLRDLGFDVERRHGHVWRFEEHRWDTSLNHLVLVVEGLPTPENPGGRWWPDVGLGDGFRDPLPLLAGDHGQDGFGYAIEGYGPDAWSYRHDPLLSFTGIKVTSLDASQPVVAAAHEVLSTPPDGRFTGLLAVHRRDATGVDSLIGVLLKRVEPTGTTETEVVTYDAWRAALTDAVGLPVDDVPDDDLRALHARSYGSFLEWDAAGRP